MQTTQPNDQTPLLNNVQRTIQLDSSSFSSGSDTDNTTSQFSSIHWRETWRLVWPYVLPETISLRFIGLLCILSVFLSKAFSLLDPYCFKLAVDAIANSTPQNIIIPYRALFLYICALLFSSLFSSIERHTFAIIECNASRRMATDLFRHILALSPDFHQNRKTGELDKALDRGLQAISNISNLLLFTLIPTIFEAVVVSAIFFKLGTPLIAVSTFIAAVFFLIYTVRMTGITIELNRELNEVNDVQGEKYYDALINYETVRSFSMENEEVDRFVSMEMDIQKRYLRFQALSSFIGFGQVTIQTIGLGIAMVVAAFGVKGGLLTPGDFVLINGYVFQLFQPLSSLGSSFKTAIQAFTDLEKCLKLFQEKITVKDLPDAKKLEVDRNKLGSGCAGEVCFTDVSFWYQGSNDDIPFILQNINFRVPPGKTLAVVGASGLGKSTILRLLMRMHDVKSGSIKIDGVDIRIYTQRSLRREVGIVSQDTLLFNETLRYNISYGSTDVNEAQVLAAAKAASLGGYIKSLPDGLDTTVGELGVKLSGGEKQRVGCARCILRNPPIVLLDEASSALDTRTEKEIQSNLRQACKNRTTIIVAHRLSTITMADEIIVLGKNEKNQVRIEERGSHAKLLEEKGMYNRMWEAQILQEESQ